MDGKRVTRRKNHFTFGSVRSFPFIRIMIDVARPSGSSANVRVIGLSATESHRLRSLERPR